MPNVDTTREIVDMISAPRSYEANVTALYASKSGYESFGGSGGRTVRKDVQI